MSKILIVGVIILAVVAIAQLTRLYELTRKLRKRREEEVSTADNRLNANLMLVFMFLFFGFFIYLTAAYGDKMLPVSASEHGETVDLLMMLNIAMISVVFFLVNGALFVFAHKYYARKGGKALYQPHNNKLEMIWTIIPSIVLFGIIISGLVVWNDINSEASDDAVVLELYSKQFDWTARYPGEDGVLGESSFNFISTTNALGLIAPETIEAKLAEIDTQIAEYQDQLENEVYSDEIQESKEVALRRLFAQKKRINSFRYNEDMLDKAYDDRIVKAEFHIPVNREVKFEFRSQDVIHSAYMPHFRAQMNTVPGMTTTFKFTPTITTDSMRLITGNEDFNYVLLCNKICGAAHYNMQMNIVVESEADYKKWLEGQKTFEASLGLGESETEEGIADNNIKVD